MNSLFFAQLEYQLDPPCTPIVLRFSPTFASLVFYLSLNLTVPHNRCPPLKYLPILSLTPRAMEAERLTPPFSDEGRTPGPSGVPSKKRQRVGSHDDSRAPMPASQTVCSRCRSDLQDNSGIITFHEERSDLERTEFHISNLPTFVSALEAACTAKWATRDGSPYNRVIALLVRWQEDDLGVVDETKELEKILRDSYHYDVESWTIPSTKLCYMELATKVLSILKEHDAPDNLFILYYGGHAIQEIGEPQPTWVS